MTAELAVETASAEVLPENIVRIDDIVTITAPHAELMPDAEMTANNYQYFMLIYRYDDVLSSTVMWRHDLAQIGKEYSHCSKIHVVRSTVGNAESSSFYYNEIEKCLGHENPWKNRDWFRDNLLIWAELLPVQSDTNSGYVAYYQTPAKRARNIRTPIKPGRFLKKFFGHILTEPQIQDAAMEWANIRDVKAVTVTQDADEIEQVYKAAHLGSCMWFHRGEHTGHVHPARVYAGPDLGIAYTGVRDNPTARTLVWPDKKIYLTKSYGDTHRLYGALDAQGYKPAEKYAFGGARIQKIECENHEGRFIMPYLDTHERALDEGDYFSLSDEGYYARNTNGHTGWEFACNECDSQVQNETTTVYGDHEVCEHCLASGFFECEIDDQWYRTGDRERRVPDGYIVSRRGVINAEDWFFCDITRMYYPECDYSYVTLMDGNICERDHADENGFRCEKTENYSFDMSKRLTLANDLYIHIDSFASREELDQWLTDNETELLSPEAHPFPISEAA